VDYLLEKLRYNPPPLPKPKPFGLEESIAPLREGAKGVVAIPLAIEDLLNVVGSVRGQTHWGSTIAKAWPASEEDAARALALFLDSLPSTSDPRGDDNDSQTQLKRTHLASRLSPYLARGVLSPRQVYHALSSSPDERARASFVRRICWRDYTYAVVSLFPDVTSGRPIREGYGRTVAEENGNDAGETKESHNRHLLRLWKNGATGFPLVDAGMRQLTAEGWMPQKVRLAVSTCLVEGLGGSWNDGMEHFAEYLVDYDPAINANMWMNAGCVGFDPYYVGTNYKRRPYWDKSGEYVRKWCPELRNLPDSWEVAEAQRGIGTFKVDCLYEPWSAPREILRASGVVLGETYPVRCCDERTERRRFFDTLRHKRAQWPSSGTDDRGRDVVRLGRSSDCESIGMFTPKALLGKPAAPVN
jgi:deoxyribodipyrimidine photo-lyase